LRRLSPRTLITTSLLALATGSAALAPLASADAAAGSEVGPTGTVANTSWVMRGEQGDYIVGPQTLRYDATDGMTASGTAQGVHLTVPGPAWTLDLVAPDSDVLETGRTYTGATRYPFQDASVPGLSLSGDGRGCNELTGQFTINEIAFQGQDLSALSATFEQHCEGGKPAAYGSVAWNASAPAAPVQPLVSIRTNKKHTAYGEKLVVTARVSNDSPLRTLAVYATPYGKRKVLIVQKAVDSNGVLRFPVRLDRRTSFSVLFDGGDQFRDKRDSTTVTVAAATASKMFGKFHRDGAYAVYGPRHPAIMATAVAPNHRGDCLQFRAQFKVNGQWGYDSVVRCGRLSRKSVAGVKLAYDRRLVGIPFRFRAEWLGDKENTAVNGEWKLARFSGGSSRVVARATVPLGTWRPELVAR
jgi:hypothetical protein